MHYKLGEALRVGVCGLRLKPESLAPYLVCSYKYSLRLSRLRAICRQLLAALMSLSVSYGGTRSEPCGQGALLRQERSPLTLARVPSCISCSPNFHRYG